MFCNSDSCDSAICQSDRSSRPLVMEGFYFVYDPSPLFTRMRGREILRTSRFCALRPNGVLRSSRRCKNVPAPGHSRIAEEVRVLRGGLALDALYFLARDVDRAGELVGPEHPAVDHILDLPRSEVQILGCLPQGDFLRLLSSTLLTSLPGKDGSGPPQGYTGPALLLALIHRSAWKYRIAPPRYALHDVAVRRAMLHIQPDYKH